MLTGRRVLTAAATIAALTVLVRVVGFGRTLLFAGAVGATDLGDVYQTANLVPTIIFDALAGGVLATLVVPLIARYVARGQRQRVAAVVSALLTWTVVVLSVIALGVVLFASPIAALFLGDATDQQRAVGVRMLRVFAVQVPLYGVAVVLTGVLHAHRRFVWPTVAPLLSSVVVIGTYLTFARVDGAGTDLAHASRSGELVLSIGTTLGVAALAACVVIPVRRLDLRLRARLTLVGEVRREAVRLASAGAVTVFAQQLALAVLIRLANDASDGTVVLFLLAQSIFLLPWAVLAVPLSTSAFPVLAEAAAVGDQARFDAELARTARATLLWVGLGAAALVGGAVPLGRLLTTLTATPPGALTESPPTAILPDAIPTDAIPTDALPAVFVAFAVGLFGYALFTVHVRAFNAAGTAGWAAGAAVVGWAATVAAGVTLSEFGSAERLITLAVAHSIGATVLGAASLAAIALRRGKPALTGTLRMLAVSLGGAGLAGAVGLRVSVVERPPPVALALAIACSVAIYLMVVLLVRRGHRRMGSGTVRVDGTDSWRDQTRWWDQT